MLNKMCENIPYDFISGLPKIELHAHLNGSVGTQSVLELGERLYGSNTPEFIELTKNLINFENITLDTCFPKFKLIHDLTATIEGLELATHLVIRDFVADNVIYLELRTTPKSNENMTKDLYLKTVIDAVTNSKEVKSGKIVVKLLPSIDRSKPIREGLEMLELVLKKRQQSQQYFQLIPGIDLSGNPKCGTFNELKSVLGKARDNGLKLALHCAEINNPEEVNEMLAFGMERCGHGTFLSVDQIIELAERNTAIECCLTSNVKCDTVTSYADHHLKHIMGREEHNDWCGIPVVCTDDSGVFDTTLTKELDIAAKTFMLNKQDLVRLQLNAVDHAFTEHAMRKEMREKILNYYKNWDDIQTK